MRKKIRVCVAGILSWLRVSYYRFMGVNIGKRCYISSGAHVDIGQGRVSIGNRVSIASGAYILAHAGGRAPLKEGEKTRLEDNVTVFVNAVVFPGVTIGKNSVVSAGAVVTNDVPSNVTVFGNPARVSCPRGNRPRE